MSKILDKILELKEDFASDWRPDLERIGILDDIKKLYSEKWSTEQCNRVLAFIVLAYDNQSGYLETHKNRWSNKEKIAKLVGLDPKEKLVKEIIQNQNQTALDLVAWYMDYQSDWRWEAIIAHYEYASEVMQFARAKTEEEMVIAVEADGKKVIQTLTPEELAKGNTAKGKNLLDAIEHRRKGDELLKEIQEEFVTVDTILHQEGKKKITDKGSVEDWQVYIKSLRGIKE